MILELTQIANKKVMLFHSQCPLRAVAAPLASLRIIA